MASVTITLTSICSGGNHLTFAITGAKAMVVRGVLSELTEPVSDEEAQAFVKVITKLVKQGRTVNQARTLLQAGVQVIV